ncbi:MAG: MarR family transcriptional regulator [Bacillota bacterium]|nr:MarR family transcriptional regulator [Bacillota bacterium]
MNARLPLMSKLGVIFLTWRRYLQKDLVPYKITLKQQYVLNQLSNRDFLYPSQIADMLFCDRPTATVVIKNMERDKWVRREKDNENGKQVRIFITNEGREKLVSLKSSIKPPKDHEFDPLKCLTQEEKDQLDMILTKILAYIKTDGNKYL